VHGFEFIPLTIYTLYIQLSSPYGLPILLHTREITVSTPVEGYSNAPLASCFVLLWQVSAIYWS